MLPSGHIASGAVLGVWRSRGARRPALVIAGAVAATTLPDIDLVIPSALDRLGVRHGLNSGTHHSWATHTPLFWGLTAAGARRLARRPRAPAWAAGASDTLALGLAVHIAEDAVANTVALLWPLRRREYGLGLDRLAGVTDHVEYARRYPSSPAGRLEIGLVLAALTACAWRARSGRTAPARII
jgi:hypothetical protein